MHYEYRFPNELLKIGWEILVDAGLNEELSYCHLPQSWEDKQIVDLKKLKIRTGPYILIDEEFLGLTEENNTFDYLSEIESHVCHRYDIVDDHGHTVEPIPVKKIASYMFDLIMYCIDMRVNGD